jgi:hypothetical protein
MFINDTYLHSLSAVIVVFALDRFFPFLQNYGEKEL